MKQWTSIAAITALCCTLLAACGSDQQVVMPTPDDVTSETSVTVTYGESSRSVVLDQFTTVSVSGADYVNLADVIATAIPDTSLDQLLVTNFIATDGFMPTASPNCTGMLPLEGVTLEQGYISPSTRNLTWDADLGYAGCMSVKDTEEILIEDKE